LKDFVKDIVKPNIEEFKKAYEECEEDGEFTFMGGEYYKGYAKYLIQYIEEEYGA